MRMKRILTTIADQGGPYYRREDFKKAVKSI